MLTTVPPPDVPEEGEMEESCWGKRVGNENTVRFSKRRNKQKEIERNKRRRGVEKHKERLKKEEKETEGTEKENKSYRWWLIVCKVVQSTPGNVSITSNRKKNAGDISGRRTDADDRQGINICCLTQNKAKKDMVRLFFFDMLIRFCFLLGRLQRQRHKRHWGQREIVLRKKYITDKRIILTLFLLPPKTNTAVPPSISPRGGFTDRILQLPYSAEVTFSVL
jgi:hypothetical protein